MSHTLMSLDAEWRQLARSGRARRALRQWSIAHPVLRGLPDLDGLLERRRDDHAAPAILRALAVLAPGDDLAAPTLLQALLPGLVRLAGIAGYDDPAAIEELVSLAWERIRTYPAGRRGSVAANVLFDVRKRYRARLIDAPRSPDAEAVGGRGTTGAVGPELRHPSVARPTDAGLLRHRHRGRQRRRQAGLRIPARRRRPRGDRAPLVRRAVPPRTPGDRDGSCSPLSWPRPVAARFTPTGTASCGWVTAPPHQGRVRRR